jgi:hypothetical protein
MKLPIRFVMSVHLTICPCVKAWLPPEIFMKFDMETFMEICQENLNLVKIKQKAPT